MSIVKVGGKFKLVSKKTGKNLGTYDTKAGAEKRERQVQYFKHMGEEWTEKYKKSIDCSNPKGFSQRAHCQGRKKKVNEDAPTNSVGGGAVAGLGVPNPSLPNQAEPGIKRFAGSRVFKVPTKNFVMAKMLKRKFARFESYLGDPVIAKQISEYASKNWKEGIVLEDEQTGAMVYLRYGRGK